MALKSKMGAATKEIVELRVLRPIAPGNRTTAASIQLKLQFRRKNGKTWHDVPVIDVDAVTGMMINDED